MFSKRFKWKASKSLWGSLLLETPFFLEFSLVWLFWFLSSEHISADGGKTALEIFPVAYVPVKN